MIKASIPANFVNWGSFYIDMFIVENKKQVILVENDILSFTLNNRELEAGQWMGKEPGGITPRFVWDMYKTK